MGEPIRQVETRRYYIGRAYGSFGVGLVTVATYLRRGQLLFAFADLLPPYGVVEAVNLQIRRQPQF